MEKELGRKKRYRRSGKEVEELVGKYRESGQTQEEFALGAGIKVGTLRGILYRRKKRESEGPLLREVKLVGLGSVFDEGGERIYIRSTDGVEVSLPCGGEPGWVERVLGIVLR